MRMSSNDVPIGPLLPGKPIIGTRRKRAAPWWLSVKASCCRDGREHLCRNKNDWSLECDGCMGFDDLKFCHWCGVRLEEPTV